MRLQFSYKDQKDKFIEVLITENKEYYSIGELALKSGISENSLRIWERRYGVPVPERLASGHRRYSSDQLVWLLKVSEAIALGFKTSKVISSSPEDLNRFLGMREDPEVKSEFLKIMEYAKTYQEEKIESVLLEAYKKTNPILFCDEFLSPLLILVGHSWAKSEIAIRHEHFISALVEKFLRSLQHNFTQEKKPALKKILLCTIEGEYHYLGLLMAELTCEYLGVKVVFLGSNTPVSEIIAMTFSVKFDAVALGVSLSSSNIETDRTIKILRKEINPQTKIILGSKGARGNRLSGNGIYHTKDMSSFKNLIMGVEN